MPRQSSDTSNSSSTQTFSNIQPPATRTASDIKSYVRNILLADPLFPKLYADVVIASAPNSNEAKILARNYQKIIDRIKMPNTPVCSHIKVNGTRCGSPALFAESSFATFTSA